MSFAEYFRHLNVEAQLRIKSNNIHKLQVSNFPKNDLNRVSVLVTMVII